MKEHTSEAVNFFKKCPSCEHIWQTRDDFIRDPDVTVVGYQVNFNKLELGFVLCNHRICKTTMALAVRAFRDLYAGPVYQERLEGTDDCPGYCIQQAVLEKCPARCECAFVREILHRIRTRQTDPS